MCMYVYNIGVYNTTAFGRVMNGERSRFLTLYKRRAMLHHYTEYMESELIAVADQNVSQLIADYEHIENGTFSYENQHGQVHKNTHISSSGSSSDGRNRGGGE